MGDYIALSELQITQPTSLQSQYYEQVNKLMQERNLEFTFLKETFYFLNYKDTYQFSFETEVYQNQIKEQTIQQLPIGLTFDEQSYKFQGILNSKYKEKVIKIYVTAKDNQNLEQTESFEIDYTSIILAYFNFEEEGMIKNKAPNTQQQEQGSTNNLIYDNSDKSYEFSGQQNEYIDTNFSDFPAQFSFFMKIKTTNNDYVILATNQKCGENCQQEQEPGFTIFMSFGWWSVSVIDESGNSNTMVIDIINDGQEHMIGFYTHTTKKITFYQDGVIKKNSPNCPFAYAHDCLGNCINFLHMFSGQCQTGMLDYGKSDKIAYFDCPELNCIDNLLIFIG
ncbi:Concanavalin A-like lectin/glucanases superfamily [Pseudocohnilembus persalinus]|uniref:Concanavalin A-like lectin/glucanases superfamily n=1 Tax=Pseudocohnilembus persalinus TaxID=266149 RepID=A0A0V0R0K7_PSEPJ|nr:Concanavalin A-like lectin/glucanases superfamily [Pseudocohnilembus persalinus]|eukprot:KRX07985.1 Concanavalin A-like lectin/glucanases superfamily [Pseudocohnilembus persalinus]